MVWVVSGPAWGCCFTSIKVCSSHTNSLRKSEKTVQKVLFLACGGPLTEDGLENSNFQAVFFRFSQRVRMWRANVYRGETTSPSRSRNNPYHVRKVWELFKKSIFWFFFDQFSWAPPMIVNHCKVYPNRHFHLHTFLRKTPWKLYDPFITFRLQMCRMNYLHISKSFSVCFLRLHFRKLPPENEKNSD